MDAKSWGALNWRTRSKLHFTRGHLLRGEGGEGGEAQGGEKGKGGDLLKKGLLLIFRGALLFFPYANLSWP